MNNRFTVTIEFSYKGETFELTAQIDLDECMEQLDTIPDLHDLLAKRNGIDSYSYQYEVLTVTVRQSHLARLDPVMWQQFANGTISLSR